MAAENTTKSYTLRPSWKYFFFSYLFAAFLTPLVIGIFALYLVRKRHKKIKYTITDRDITSTDARHERKVDLSSIRDVSVSQTWMQDKLNIGDVILHTSSLDVPLKGIEDPHSLKGLIEKAVAADGQRGNRRDREAPGQGEYKPGSMEKMNYLTGLWQQGLLSDEEYHKEKKHFE